MKEEKQWDRITPRPTSNINHFQNEEDRKIFREYFDKPDYSRLVPTESSIPEYYMNDADWNGLEDFNQRRAKPKRTSIEVSFGIQDEAEVLVTKDTYPYDSDFIYSTEIRRLNLDEERRDDFAKGKGIRIERSQGIKKDIKEENSIYSPLFGPTFDDVSANGSRYACRCGALQGQQNLDMVCQFCGQKVTKKERDFSIFGWIVLDHDVVIHPGLYKSIDVFFGKKPSVLDSIINTDDNKDENGFAMEKKNPAHPYTNIGIIGFHEKFDEIMDYFLKKHPERQAYYDDIMRDRDKVFTHSIPIFTTLLRPYHLNGDKFAFEDTNKNFNIMANLGYLLNTKEIIKGNRNKKTRNQLLYDLQFNFNEVYNEVINILAYKKGIIRSLYGGRYNFTSRCVIVPNWKLRSDQICLPYRILVKLLEYSIINILHNTYGMTMYEARTCWTQGYESYNQRIWDIVQYIIQASGEGIPFFINRNPTLQYGSILQMYCVGCSKDDPENCTLELPLMILPLLNADFDGDAINIILLINEDLKKTASEVFNPRNAMHVSRNDGLMEPFLNLRRDVLILTNALLGITNDNYSKQDIAEINACKNWKG